MISENLYRVSITAMCIASLFLNTLSLKKTNISKKRKNMVVIGGAGSGRASSLIFPRWMNQDFFEYVECVIPHIQKCMKENKHPKTESETTKTVLDYMFHKQLISEEEKKRYIKEWCEPNANFVVTDPKGTLIKETGHLFEKKGYRIEVLDLDKNK